MSHRASREKRLRRLARQCELELVKRRSLIARTSDKGTYALIDPVRRILVLGDPTTGYGRTLDEIEDFLERIRDALSRCEKAPTSQSGSAAHSESRPRL